MQFTVHNLPTTLHRWQIVPQPFVNLIQQNFRALIYTPNVPIHSSQNIRSKGQTKQKNTNQKPKQLVGEQFASGGVWLEAYRR